jgi:surface polysaccharide O-acyltransferase-like enzyme
MTQGLTTAETTPVAEPSAGAARSRRWAGLEVARFWGAMAIIWIHVPRSVELAPWTIIARFGVPFFTAAAVYFVVQKAATGGMRDWLSYALGRVQRIYLPFLAWCAVYLAFKAVKALVAPEQDNDFGGIDMLWKGSAYHLWFLPFILLVSVAAYPMGAIAARGPQLKRMIAGVTLALGLLVALVPMSALPAIDDKLTFMWQALPAALWGVSLGVATRFDGRENRKLLTASLVVFASAMAVLIAVGRNPLLENIAGVAWLLVAFTWAPGPWMSWVAPQGANAFGMYCSHLLFVKVLESIFAKLRLPFSPWTDVTTMVVATLGSILVAWALSRRRATRWMVV